MHSAAQNVESAQPALAYATVEKLNGRDIAVRTAHGRIQARRAAGCLLAPAAGDQVLLSEDHFGRAYILAVLERPEGNTGNQLTLDGATQLEVTGGELIIIAEQGIALASPAHVSLASAELDVHAARAEIGLETTHMAGKSFSAHIERIRTVARTVDSFIHNWVQRMTSCFRYVRELDETQAAAARQLVEGTLTVQTGNSVHLAEGHVKIDAEQIHLG